MYEQFYRNYQPIPQMQLPQVPQYQAQTPSPDERIWVQNETAADSYLVAPNGFVRLWDASVNRFYEKRADATGRPLPMDVYEYSKKNGPAPEPIKEDDSDIRKEIAALQARIEALEKIKEVKKNVKSKPDAEDTDA
mgnify:CR=1 FL=1